MTATRRPAAIQSETHPSVYRMATHLCGACGAPVNPDPAPHEDLGANHDTVAHPRMIWCGIEGRTAVPVATRR